MFPSRVWRCLATENITRPVFPPSEESEEESTLQSNYTRPVSSTSRTFSTEFPWKWRKWMRSTRRALPIIWRSCSKTASKSRRFRTCSCTLNDSSTKVNYLITTFTLCFYLPTCSIIMSCDVKTVSRFRSAIHSRSTVVTAETRLIILSFSDFFFDSRTHPSLIFMPPIN